MDAPAVQYGTVAGLLYAVRYTIERQCFQRCVRRSNGKSGESGPGSGSADCIAEALRGYIFPGVEMTG